jgi:hypothetical protein
LALALAKTALAQTGPLPLPAPPAVSQSEPGHGPLQERYNQLLQRQRAFSQARDAHNGRCLGIPKNDKARIAACQQSKQSLDRERAAYGTALREYEANQAFWQGRTLYLRDDYDGAIAKYYRALSLSTRPGAFDGDVSDEIDLARAGKAAKAGDMETANTLLCQIEDRGNARPSWLETQARLLFGKVRSWMMSKRKKFQVRTPAAICGIRG